MVKAYKLKGKLAQEYLTLCDSMDHTVHGILQAIILETPTQGSNPGFPHCKLILYQLSHKGSPRIQQIKSKGAIYLNKNSE